MQCRALVTKLLLLLRPRLWLRLRPLQSLLLSFALITIFAAERMTRQPQFMECAHAKCFLWANKIITALSHCLLLLLLLPSQKKRKRAERAREREIGRAAATSESVATSRLQVESKRMKRKTEEVTETLPASHMRVYVMQESHAQVRVCVHCVQMLESERAGRRACVCVSV